MTVFLITCSVIVMLCFIAQTIFMYGIVNHLQQIKEERLLVQRVVSNERWI